MIIAATQDKEVSLITRRKKDNSAAKKGVTRTQPLCISLRAWVLGADTLV